MAENATHTLHNILTAARRGRPRRPDLVALPQRGDRPVRRRRGRRLRLPPLADLGQATGSSDLLTHQRDLYAYLHDQTLRLLNQGYTGTEIAEELRAAAGAGAGLGTPAATTARSATTSRRSTSATWAGSTATPPTSGSTRRSSTAKRYVAGPRRRRRGDREAASGTPTTATCGSRPTLLNHAVFADPGHTRARQELAAVYEPLGHGAENGTWRNFYLTGAMELRGTLAEVPPDVTGPEVAVALSVDRLLDSLAIRIDGPAAAEFTLSFDCTSPTRTAPGV